MLFMSQSNSANHMDAQTVTHKLFFFFYPKHLSCVGDSVQIPLPQFPADSYEWLHLRVEGVVHSATCSPVNSSQKQRLFSFLLPFPITFDP